MDWEKFCHDRDWVVLFHRKLSMSEVEFNFSSSFDRKPCPHVDENSEELWTKLCQGNKRLYNASKFRFHGVTRENAINVGLTDYKTSMCTNQLKSKDELYEYGLKEFDDQHACLSNPIAVNCVVLTNDGYVVLIKRANWVSEAKGMVDTPGGHAEPEDATKKAGLKESDVRELTGEQVKYEIFHCMVREIRDELNIPEDRIGWPTLIGLIRNKSLGYKPCFLFKTSCNVTKKEVEDYYAQGGPETDESTELLFLPQKELQTAKTKSEMWLSIVEKMAPCGQAAMYLYCH